MSASPLQAMTATDAFVYEGALDPESLKIDVLPVATLPDLTVVTSADILPIYDGVQLAPWVIDVYGNQTTTTLQLLHRFRVGEATKKRLGLHKLVVRLYVGVVLRRCIPKNLFVIPLG